MCSEKTIIYLKAYISIKKILAYLSYIFQAFLPETNGHCFDKTQWQWLLVLTPHNHRAFLQRDGPGWNDWRPQNTSMSTLPVWESAKWSRCVCVRAHAHARVPSCWFLNTHRLTLSVNDWHISPWILVLWTRKASVSNCFNEPHQVDSVTILGAWESHFISDWHVQYAHGNLSESYWNCTPHHLFIHICLFSLLLLVNLTSAFYVYIPKCLCCPCKQPTSFSVVGNVSLTDLHDSHQ